MRFAAGSQLAQINPSNTNSRTLFSPSVRTEVTQLVIANVTGSAATFGIYHDDDGTTYDDSTALYKAISIAANSTVTITADGGPGTGFIVGVGGSIGIESSVADALTFTAYGVTEDVAPSYGASG